eukprot:6154601-Pleurochrysis_carterae.AAC.1
MCAVLLLQLCQGLATLRLVSEALDKPCCWMRPAPCTHAITCFRLQLVRRFFNPQSDRICLASASALQSLSKSERCTHL